MESEKKTSITHTGEATTAEKVVPQETNEIRETFNNASDYLPTLEQINHKDVAAHLVDQVDQATADLKSAIELAKQKYDYLPLLKTKAGIKEIESKGDEAEYGENFQRIDILIRTYESKHPFQSLLEIKSLPPTASQYLYRLNKYKDLLSTTTKIKSLWNRSAHAERVEAANTTAKGILSSIITDEVKEIDSNIRNQAKPYNPDHDIRQVYRKFLGTQSEEELSLVIENLESVVRSQQESQQQLASFRTAVNQLLNLKGKCEGALDSSIDATNRSLSNFESSINSVSNFIQQDFKEPDIAYSIQGAVEELKRKFFYLFHESAQGNIMVKNKAREQWSLTKEFISAVKAFNKEIAEAEKISGMQIGEYNSYYFRQITEAKEVSSGRLLTHSGPNSHMYDVLKKADLSSVSEQRKKYGKSKRTHAREQHEDSELHDISFDIDRVYGNLTRAAGDAPPADIALVFSENQILSQEHQYLDADGRHIFDKDFSGEHEESPGLSIDLMDTPFMIVVTEKERISFVEFIKDQSAWSSQLSGLSEAEFSEWLQQNVIFVNELKDFKGDKATKELFTANKNVPIKRGYAELTDTQARMKVETWPTNQFVPF